MNKSPARIVTGVSLVLLLAAAGWFWYAGSEIPATEEDTVLLQEAIERFEQENYAGALEILQRIPSNEVTDWRVPYYIGSSLMMLQNYQQAVQPLEQSLAMNSQQTGVLYALGVTHFKLGKIGLAKAYFAAILEIDPDDEDAKGLMDIMAKLERQQPGQAEEKSTGEEGTGESGH